MSHLQPSRHPWIWGMAAWLLFSEVFRSLWPWHGWTERLVLILLFVLEMGTIDHVYGNKL
jgi:hypothetical protein